MTAHRRMSRRTRTLVGPSRYEELWPDHIERGCELHVTPQVAHHVLEFVETEGLRGVTPGFLGRGMNLDKQTIRSNYRGGTRHDRNQAEIGRASCREGV